MKFLIVCLVACLSFVNGVLYEDQIDSFSWHAKKIGHIQSINQLSNNALIVSSKQGVTASLSIDQSNSANEGLIDWRYTTPNIQSNLVDQTVDQSTNRIYTLEHLTGVVRCHSENGGLKWESDRLIDSPIIQLRNPSFNQWKHSSGESINQSIEQGLRLTSSGVLVWINQSITLLSLNDGLPIWNRALNQSVSQVGVSDSSVVVLTSESINQSIKFQMFGFALSDASSVNMPGPISQSNDQSINLSNDASFLAFYDRSTSTIVMIDLSSNQSVNQFGKTSLPTASLMGSSATKDPIESISQFAEWSKSLIIRTKGYQHVFSISQSNKALNLRLVRSLPSNIKLSVNSVSVDGKQRWAGFRTQSIDQSVSQLTMVVYEVGAMEPVQSISQPIRRGEVTETAWLFNQQSKMVIAAVTNDHRLIVSINQSVVVMREEAMSSISQMTFVVLPPSSALIDQSVSHLTWPARIKAQIASLQQSINHLITFQWASMMTSDQASIKQSINRSNNQSIASDEFGFRQMIVGSTNELIIGIESEFGTTQYIVRLIDQSISRSIKQSIWKVFHVSPRCLTVLIQSIDLSNEKSISYRLVDLDPVDGSIINQSTESINQSISVAIKLPLIDPLTEKHILLLAHRDRVWFHPSISQSNQKLIDQSINQLHYYHVDSSSNTMEGYSFQSIKQSIDQSVVQSMLVYSYAFPSNERVVAVEINQSNNQSISSSTKMLGDMSGVLYKYLDQNLIAIATERSVSQSVNQSIIASLSKSSDPSVCVYLIDSVSGGLIEKLVHKNAVAPVTLVVSENEVFYSYLNSQLNSPVLTSVEIFEARSGVGLSLLNAMTRSKMVIDNFDGFAETAPTLLTASFITRGLLVDLTCTRSQRGITSRECIGLSVTGQLIGWSSTLLNSRRTIHEPSVSDRAEGLIPYSPALPTTAQTKLSANHTIVKGLHLITTPTRLESTSIICVHGVDIWCTRVTPSTAFDRLNEDFNYALLGLTVMGVVIAIVMTHQMAKQKELKAAWK